MKRILKTTSIIILGNIIYSLAVAFFIEPSGLIMGGVTGLALFAHNYFGVSTSLVALIFNVSLFMLGWIFLGNKFAASTLLSTFVFPLTLQLAEMIAHRFEYTHDLFLCTVFGGIIIGAALGIVIRTGASTGGMDIPPLILHRYFGLPISGLMWAFDIVILIIQALFSQIDLILYGIILVIIYTIVMDKALMLGKSKIQIQVVSKKNDDIRHAILSDIDRGVTLIHSRTGYLGEETEMVMSVISTRELHMAERIVHEIDPTAFMIITKVSEVKGLGFSQDKKYIKKQQAQQK